MRRVLALAVAASLIGGAASAETWTKYTQNDSGLAWSYDADYTYKDRDSGRIVVMQAISKPAANLGPSAPGKPDGVGNVVALDCLNKNMIMLGSYKPSAPLDIKASWRTDTPKKATDPDNVALMDAVCPTADKVPVK